MAYNHGRYWPDESRYSQFTRKEEKEDKTSLDRDWGDFYKQGGLPRINYKLGRNDNLWDISNRFGISPRQLADANRNMYRWHTGTSIRLPRWEDITREMGRLTKSILFNRGQNFLVPETVDLGGMAGQTETRSRRVPSQEALESYYGRQYSQGAIPRVNAPRAEPTLPGQPTRFSTYQRMWTDAVRNTNLALRHFGVRPEIMSSRMSADIGLTAQDMTDLGYQKVGDWWQLWDVAEPIEASAAYSGGYGSNYRGYGRGGGGWGGGGGGGAGGGRIPYSAEEQGIFSPSMTGRIFLPEFSGLIRWRL